jgi:hypothetical protein
MMGDDFRLRRRGLWLSDQDSAARQWSAWRVLLSRLS